MGQFKSSTSDANLTGTTAAGAIRAADFLRALANPHRLMILQLLHASQHSVMEICELLQLRQSLVSQHLARLRLDGVVHAERQGHFVVYSLPSGKAREILGALSGMMASEEEDEVTHLPNGKRFVPSERVAG